MTLLLMCVLSWYLDPLYKAYVGSGEVDMLAASFHPADKGD